MAAKRKTRKKAKAAAPVVKRKRGGQTKFTAALADSLLEWLSQGHVMQQWLDDNDIGRRTVQDWVKANHDYGEDGFAAEFARAKDAGFDAIADRIRLTSQQLELGTEHTVTDDEDGRSERVLTKDMLGHRRLKIETDLKLLAKWDPKRYGDKIEHDHKSSSLEVLVLAAAARIEKPKE